jgi:prevent-host-death family protein
LHARLAELIDRVCDTGERIVVNRAGEDIVALVPLDDFELLELLEDRLDLVAVNAALADPANASPIAWEHVKAELGL